ncbi:MAG TPA: hypothetical protein LFV92_05695 [Rickettsia endosymbiont of Ceroptres masudai]|nr:hypothetical protein [Rickettsia endosymbiont of Ceroptres masudai]
MNFVYQLFIYSKYIYNFNLDLSPKPKILILDKELILIPLKNKIKEFQALVKSRNKDNISLVDSLIESRRKEFNNEYCLNMVAL